MDSENKKFADKIVGFIVGKPVWAIVLGVVIVAATAVGVKYPGLQANFTHTAFFQDDDYLLQRFNAFERQFSNDDVVAIVVHSPSGIFDKDSIHLVHHMTERLWKVPFIKRSESITNFNWVRAQGMDLKVSRLIPDPEEEPLTDALLAERKQVALTHEVLPRYLISPDGTTAMIYGRVIPGFEKPTDHPTIVNAVREMIKDVKKEMADAKIKDDHEFHITGGVAINTAFKESAASDLQRIMPMLLGVTMLILIGRFRSIRGTLLPLVVVGLGVLAGLGVAGLVGVEMSTITITLPQIMIAVGVADAVHILTVYYLARRRGLDYKQGTYHSLHKNLVPTILTSISTALGFAAFATASLKPIIGLGIIAAAGTLAAWIITYFIVGGVLALLPWRIKSDGSKTSAEDALAEPGAKAQAYTSWLQRFRWPLIGGTLALTAVGVFMSFKNTVDSDPFRYFAKGYPVRDAQDFVRAKVGGVISYELVIHSGKEDGVKDPAFLKKVEAFEEAALKQEGIVKAVSVVEILKQTHRAVMEGEQQYYKLPEPEDESPQAYEDATRKNAELFLMYTSNLPQGMDLNDRITTKYESLRLSLIGNVSASTKWMATRDRLESIGKEMGLNVEATGKALLYQGMNDHVVESFIRSFVTAVVLISLLLIIVFRSVKVGLVAMIPNMIPLFIGGLILFIIKKPIDIGTVLVASVCLGIAVDDTIHVLSNFARLRRKGVPPKQAVAGILTHTAPALIMTTMVLVAAFGMFGLGTFMPNVYFGILTATVLLTALVIDLTFLPALLLVLDRGSMIEAAGAKARGSESKRDTKAEEGPGGSEEDA